MQFSDPEALLLGILVKCSCCITDSTSRQRQERERGSYKMVVAGLCRQRQRQSPSTIRDVKHNLTLLCGDSTDAYTHWCL